MPDDELRINDLPVNRLVSVRWADTGEDIPNTPSPRLPDILNQVPDPMGRS